MQNLDEGADDAQGVAARVAEIAAIADDDGVVFSAGSVSTRTIRDGALYHGVRVAVDARIGTARVKLRLDVNFGDPVTPAPHVVELPALRPGMEPVRGLGYPIDASSDRGDRGLPGNRAAPPVGSGW